MINVRLLFSTFSELLDNHEVFLCNIILLLHSYYLFLLPLVIWEKASFPCLHIDKPNRCCDYGLIVWDCNPKTVNTPNIEVHEVRAVVVVYDITDSSSFDEAKDHVQKLSQKRSRSLVVGLVGSKADLLMHRKIKYEVSSYYNYIHV